eukprot:16960-Heterococcus_DN1.PRE.2
MIPFISYASLSTLQAANRLFHYHKARNEPTSDYLYLVDITGHNATSEKHCFRHCIAQKKPTADSLLLLLIATTMSAPTHWLHHHSKARNEHIYKARNEHTCDSGVSYITVRHCVKAETRYVVITEALRAQIIVHQFLLCSAIHDACTEYTVSTTTV